MAKLGEGDPRWIVSDRADGHNVNDWHWQEKDVTPNAKKIFRNLIKEMKMPGKDVEFTQIKSINGEATIVNRKKKKYLVYQLSATIMWKGTYFGHSISGKVTLDEIADDVTNPEDIDVRFTITNSPLTKEEQRQVKIDFIREFRNLVIEFQNKVSKEYSIIIPKQINNVQVPEITKQSSPYKKLGAIALVCSITLGIGIYYYTSKNN